MFVGWIVRHTMKHFLGREGDDILRHYLMLTADPDEAVRWVREGGSVHAGDPIVVIGPQYA